MRYLKKYIKKLYHLIWFLSVWFLFVPIINAETITDMTYSQFRTGASAYSVTYNNEIYRSLDIVSVNMSYSGGFPFEWISNYNMKCTGQTTISGRMRLDGNPNLNYDWLTDNIQTIYYAPNINGVSPSSCSWSVNPNNLEINYSCVTTQPNNNYIIGGKFRNRVGSFSVYFSIFRQVNITCDNSANAIIDNNNTNTQSIINNNNNNTNSINNNNNNNTNSIINNDNQNTQDIIDSSGSNTQSIIDNQNENSNKEIESQKVCQVIDKNSTTQKGYLSSSNGLVSTVDSTNRSVTNYISINKDTKIKNIVINSDNLSNNLCFYNINKTFLSCLNSTNYNNQDILIPNNASYVRFTINTDTNYPQFEICKNGNQALNDSVNGLNDTLNDSSIDNSDDTINNLKNRIPTNSVISDLLLLPVRFLQNFVNALGSSCSQFNLGSLYGTNLYMPCINVESYLGSAIWTAIDLIISGMFVYALRKKFIEIYMNLTNLKNGGNEVD